MEVPENCIVVTGTADPLVDTRTQNSIDLPPIDRLEAFDPTGRCIYKQVMVAVETNNLIRSVWLYHFSLGYNAKRIASGRLYPAK